MSQEVSRAGPDPTCAVAGRWVQLPGDASCWLRWLASPGGALRGKVGATSSGQPPTRKEAAQRKRPAASLLQTLVFRAHQHPHLGDSELGCLDSQEALPFEGFFHF